MIAELTNDGVSLSNISFVHVPCERMWVRDHGPFAVNTDLGVTYLDFDDKADSGYDEYLPTNLAKLWGLDYYQRSWIFDGGNLLVDSHGTLFCTDALYTNNPGVLTSQIDHELELYMGIGRVIPLKRQYDDYWAHIDMQVKLLNDTTFVISSVSPSSQSYDSLEYNFSVLDSLTAPNGQSYRIERLPHAEDWKTYANSLILNNKVLVPIYGHANDSIALQTYRNLLPNHTIRGIDCNKIIGWEGALHCITMQLFDPGQVSRIKDLSKKQETLKVFPNPSAHKEPAHCKISAVNNQKKQLLIFDELGKLQFSKSLINTLAEHLISLPSSLPPGKYQIVIQNKTGIEKTGSWVVSNL